MVSSMKVVATTKRKPPRSSPTRPIFRERKFEILDLKGVAGSLGFCVFWTTAQKQMGTRVTRPSNLYATRTVIDRRYSKTQTKKDQT